MSDRLQELLQQRALLQSHLAWLDREIAAATGGTPSSTASAVSNTGAPLPAAKVTPPSGIISPPIQPVPAIAADAEADQILAQYRQDSMSVRTDVCKGCLLYFLGAFLLLGLVLAIIYFFYAQRHLPDAESDANPPAAPAQR